MDTVKTLKFRSDLVPLVLDGRKTSTWRLFDDKDLREGDRLVFINKETGEEFAKAEVLKVRMKPLGEVEESDFAEGHERYKDKDDMLAHYRLYYGEKVDWMSPLKIVNFKLVQSP